MAILGTSTAVAVSANNIITEEGPGGPTWSVSCPICRGDVRRRGQPPRANRKGSFKCEYCGRRITIR